MVDIKNLLQCLQNEMNSSLKTNKNISHAPTHGAVNETLWIKFLGSYLPKRYKVNRAIIIDYQGNTSEQQDLVIYDSQYTPFIFNTDDCKYIPAESVYAVFEIKTELNKRNIAYAQKKIESVRKLNRTSAPIRHAGGKYEPKKPQHIIGGIITSNTSWKDGLGKSFKESIISSCQDKSRIDIGIALSAGAFNIDYDNNEVTNIDISSNENSLIIFFGTLFAMLQNCGTVPAIDIQKYLSNLK